MWDKIKLIAASISSDTWEFLKPLLKVYLTKAGKVLAIVALEAVKSVAASYGDKDGATKRKAAFDIVRDNLTKQGIEMGTSFINAAIETAYIKYKSSK